MGDTSAVNEETLNGLAAKLDTLDLTPAEQQVIEVVQPFPKVRIGPPDHARAGIVPNPLHGRVRREACRYRFHQPPVPAAIMGEH